MGRATLGIRRIELPKFDKGFFPNKDLDDVPEGGSSDCKHSIWYRSALRKFPGMDRVNSSQAATLRGNGFFYLNVNGATKRSAVFGAGFYEDVSGTWTARTGAVTITDGANNLVQAINHQQGANKYAIYVNDTDPPWKWTGSGNASALGGSPPANFGTIAKYHDIIFGAKNEIVYPSDIGDPETWPGDEIPFDKDVKRLIDNGQKLAVLMEDHIGSIQGYSPLDFSAEESEIADVGCVGRLAATSAIWGDDVKVFATFDKNGLWIVNQGFTAQKVFGENYIQEFNQTYLHKVTLAYWGVEHLLFVAAPYGDSDENDYLIIVDMRTGAFWPGPDIHGNSIRALGSARDDNGDEYIYYIDENGYAYKFNFETDNYHTGTATQAIDGRFKTKKFDLKDVHQLRQLNMLADADGNHSVTVAVNFGLTRNDGETGTISLLGDGDLLGSTFILGASTLGGSDYVFEYLSGIGGFGRFVSITFSNDELSQPFNIRKVELQMKRRRMGSVDK